MQKDIELELKTKVEIPSPPNFIRVLGRTPNKNAMIPISEFTDDQLNNISIAWGAALIDRAHQIRKQKK